MPGRIIGVAVDGSGQSQNALNWFIDNLYREGDSVVLIHVAEFNLSVGVLPNVDAISKLVKEQEEKVSTFTGGLTEMLKKKGIPGKVVRESGKPGEAIIAVAKRENVSSLVMGTRGLGTFKRTLLGSVSDFVLHNSHIPVTIVPSS
ncbi:hypothetical protein SNE40_014029 [Patella caerulea]|uniref:UspA domain-containing protein n=1 Tax=Patella caerulea TaxID=87958 RepID=A0AAN8PC15_PATCE